MSGSGLRLDVNGVVLGTHTGGFKRKYNRGTCAIFSFDPLDKNFFFHHFVEYGVSAHVVLQPSPPLTATCCARISFEDYEWMLVQGAFATNFPVAERIFREMGPYMCAPTAA